MIVLYIYLFIGFILGLFICIEAVKKNATILDSVLFGMLLFIIWPVFLIWCLVSCLTLPILKLMDKKGLL